MYPLYQIWYLCRLNIILVTPDEAPSLETLTFSLYFSGSSIPTNKSLLILLYYSFWCQIILQTGDNFVDAIYNFKFPFRNISYFVYFCELYINIIIMYLQKFRLYHYSMYLCDTVNTQSINQSKKIFKVVQVPRLEPSTSTFTLTSKTC
jgi:hypothetical protein